MPYLTFEKDYTVPRDTESYKAGEVVVKSIASINFFKNLGAPCHVSTPDEIAEFKKPDRVRQETTVKVADKPEEKTKKKPVKAGSGPSSQEAQASRAPTVTSSASVESQPSASTTPTK